MKNRSAEGGLASHEGPKQQHHCTLLATWLDPKYGPDSKIEQGQEKHRQVMTILRESSKKLDLNIGSVMQNWSDYQYKVTFSTALTLIHTDLLISNKIPGTHAINFEGKQKHSF